MKFLGKLGVAAIAVAGLATTAPAPTVQTSSPVQQSQTGKQQISQPVKTAQQIVKQSAGGFDIIGYRVGIPPHIYGTHYVRRGTHKQTNI